MKRITRTIRDHRLLWWENVRCWHFFIGQIPNKKTVIIISWAHSILLLKIHQRILLSVLLYYSHNLIIHLVLLWRRGCCGNCRLLSISRHLNARQVTLSTTRVTTWIQHHYIYIWVTKVCVLLWRSNQSNAWPYRIFRIIKLFIWTVFFMMNNMMKCECRSWMTLKTPFPWNHLLSRGSSGPSRIRNRLKAYNRLFLLDRCFLLFQQRSIFVSKLVCRTQIINSGGSIFDPFWEIFLVGCIIYPCWGIIVRDLMQALDHFASAFGIWTLLPIVDKLLSVCHCWEFFLHF